LTEFLWVTLAGFAAGVLFDAYFRRRDRWLRSALERVVR
jgi:cytochrome c biogenesis protein ResB